MRRIIIFAKCPYHPIQGIYSLPRLEYQSVNLRQIVVWIVIEYLRNILFNPDNYVTLIILIALTKQRLYCRLETKLLVTFEFSKINDKFHFKRLPFTTNLFLLI